MTKRKSNTVGHSEARFGEIPKKATRQRLLKVNSRSNENNALGLNGLADRGRVPPGETDV